MKIPMNKTGKLMMPFKALTSVAMLTVALNSHSAPTNVDELATNLIQLRGEVEELQAKLDNKQETHKNRMASLAVQSTDLQTQLQRNAMELKQLAVSLTQAKQRASKDSIQGKDLKPLVINAIAQLKQHIATGLPFKTQQRLASLNEISDQLELDLLPAHKAVNRLWAFVDDEIRLSRESGIYRQPILLGGSERLADIARVGLVGLYFQSGINEFGKVRKTANGWIFSVVHEDAQVNQIKALFDSLKKQIRSGYFQLPNSLAGAL